MRATADTLQTALEQMKAIEDLRQTLRDIRNLPKLDSN